MSRLRHSPLSVLLEWLRMETSGVYRRDGRGRAPSQDKTRDEPGKSVTSLTGNNRMLKKATPYPETNGREQ